MEEDNIRTDICTSAFTALTAPSTICGHRLTPRPEAPLQAGRHVSRRAGRHAGGQVGGRVGRQVGRQETGRPATGMQAGRQAGTYLVRGLRVEVLGQSGHDAEANVHGLAIRHGAMRARMLICKEVREEGGSKAIREDEGGRCEAA